VRSLSPAPPSRGERQERGPGLMAADPLAPAPAQPAYGALQIARARSLAEPAGMCEATTSSTQASCAAMRRVAASGLAAFSQICTRWGLALGAMPDALSIARTQAVAVCSRLAFGPAVEAPVAAVDAAALVDLTGLLPAWPQPASSSAPARASPSHLQAPRMGLP